MQSEPQVLLFECRPPVSDCCIFGIVAQLPLEGTHVVENIFMCHSSNYSRHSLMDEFDLKLVWIRCGRID
jgi:hypothetical protein